MKIGMRTQVAGGAARDPRQAMILKQIRKLEAERRKLQKELSEAAGTPEGLGAAQQGQAAIAVNAQAGAVMEQSTAPGDGIGGSPNAAGIPVSTPSPASVSANMAVVRAMSGGLSGSGGTGGSSEASAYKRSPEDIMKLIQLVTMQIMTLQEQLGQDATQVMTISMDDEEAEEGEAPGVPMPVLSQIAEPLAPVPSPAVVDGHVDGYV